MGDEPQRNRVRVKFPASNFIVGANAAGGKPIPEQKVRQLCVTQPLEHGHKSVKRSGVHSGAVLHENREEDLNFKKELGHVGSTKEPFGTAPNRGTNYQPRK